MHDKLGTGLELRENLLTSCDHVYMKVQTVILQGTTRDSPTHMPKLHNTFLPGDKDTKAGKEKVKGRSTKIILAGGPYPGHLRHVAIFSYKFMGDFQLSKRFLASFTTK